MKKLLNFEKELISWFEKNRGRKIKWGVFDCALASLEALKIVYGENITPPDLWRNKREAIRVYKSLISPVQSFVDVGFKIARYPCNGDIVVIKSEPMNMISVVINNQYTVFDTVKGFQLVPLGVGTGNYTILRRS